MTKRKYYAERKGGFRSITLEQLKQLFSQIFSDLVERGYFREAMGYNLVGSYNQKTFYPGNWGRNYKSFILTHLKREDIWPFDKWIDRWDENTLFTVVEFFHDYVSKGLDFLLFWRYNQEKGQLEYRKRMNVILEEYQKGYRLNDEGEIIEIPPPGFEELLDQTIVTTDPENIDKPIEYAILKFRRHNTTMEDKKESIRILGDVLEYLKKDSIRLERADESALFQILNKFTIRHHNKAQNSEYDRDIWYDYFFYVLLASVRTLQRMIISK